ncbi:hypothetical protein J1N35_028964 [Gossypium stocksii]|uniref:Uncharacterized protein n=1 Tax=Gossypium stocksii TaxID=47602 RepID=A0A9D3UWZ8_9ROSI|nr:hypothetical protein J1N35_028964 [Gossypium stocksii]
MQSSTKRQAHMMSVMLLSASKRPRHQEKWSVKFESDDDELIREEEGNYPMVVSVEIPGFEVKRIFVDNSSSGSPILGSI